MRNTVSFTLEDNIIDRLAIEAEKERRNKSNMLEVILLEYFESKDKKSESDSF